MQFLPTMGTGLSHLQQISPMRNPKIDYKKAKRIARRLVRKGLTRMEAARAVGVSYSTIWFWTPFAKLRNGRMNMGGITLKILKDVVSNGYVFSDDITQINSSYRTLIKYLPLRKVKAHGMTVFVLEGNERKAMEAFLKKRNLRSLNWNKLAIIRKTFGIKKMKRNDNIRERFLI